MNTILLIDLSSIAHPIWHIESANPDPNATSVQTVARIRALASGQPHVALCCDKGPYLRKAISADYKATRPEAPQALHHQIDLAIETLRADGFPVWQVKGYEADDLIATAERCAVYSPKPFEGDVSVLIVSADKDILQLVSERVGVKSLRDGTVLDEAAVVAKFGVKPNQMTDYLSLVGDTSDNVKGAKGIGAKKAAELLTKYGTIDAMLVDLHAHGTNFTPALATALREFEAILPTTRALITLRTDAPIPFEDIWKERVPADVAVFDAAGIAQDIEESMPTLEQEVPPAVSNRPATGGAQAPPATPPPMPAPAMLNAPQVMLAPREMELLPPPALEFEKQLEPRSMSHAVQLAGLMFKARLFSAYGTPEGILSTILAGRELGLQAMASLRGMHIIEGKPCMSADLIRALVLKSGHAKFFRPTERTATSATWETQRGEDPPVTLTFTIEEAQQAGVVKPGSGWAKFPADMLTARASSKLARLVYSDVVFNLYSPEDMA